MTSFLRFCFLACSITLQGCAATGYVLDNYVGDESTYQLVESTDRMLAIGQIQHKDQKQGMLFLGEQHSYLITRGAPQLMSIIQQIPAEKRLLISPLPVEFRVNADTSNHFNGNIEFAYATPLNELTPQSIQELKNLGFNFEKKLKDHNQQEKVFLTAPISFEGTIYQAVPSENIQHQFSQPYPLVLKQHVRITQPHSTTKSAVGLMLAPLALAVDIITLPVGIVVGTGVVGYSATQPDAWK